jgi:hypothetical protein
VIQSGSRLLGFFRGGGELRGRQFVAISDGLGETWKTERSVLGPEAPDSARLAAPFAVENPRHPGEILVLTTERAVPGNTPGRIWLWRGDAQRLDWRRERALLEFPHIPDDPTPTSAILGLFRLKTTVGGCSTITAAAGALSAVGYGSKSSP